MGAVSGTQSSCSAWKRLSQESRVNTEHPLRGEEYGWKECVSRSGLSLVEKHGSELRQWRQRGIYRVKPIMQDLKEPSQGVNLGFDMHVRMEKRTTGGCFYDRITCYQQPSSTACIQTGTGDES